MTAAMVKIMGPKQCQNFLNRFQRQALRRKRAYAQRMSKFLRHASTTKTIISAEVATYILPKVISFLDETVRRSVGAARLICWRNSRSRYVTVALAGDGGDELFAGYDTFRALGLLEAFITRPSPNPVHRGAGCAPLASKIARDLRKLLARFPDQAIPARHESRPKASGFGAGWARSFRKNCPNLLEPGACSPASSTESLVQRQSNSLHKPRLEKFDRRHARRVYVHENVSRATACSPKSIARRWPADLKRAPRSWIPEFVALAGQVPSRLKHKNGLSKYILRKALKGMLPEDILNRPKKGFGIPIGDWFRGRLRDMLQDTLHERRIKDGGILRPAAVKSLIDDHLAGRRDNRKPLWTLFMFELWREHWLKQYDAPHDDRSRVISNVAKENLVVVRD